MFDDFSKLYEEVCAATKCLHDWKACHPHYQRVLDYIHAHPGERSQIAKILSRSFNICLLQFLMPTLRWPEIRIAAEERMKDGGNHFHDGDLKELLEIYAEK
ncbi:MAG TPA: hypothetical protein VH413_11300 [Verrucomicrobiae bacterium]|jgi:hypothetical protein|nr:hypothetical protein [Verrucomicrobiae bacterium]